MQTQADHARDLARALLEPPLPRRWAHSRGVAGCADMLASIVGADADLLHAAAWLHDIGYAPDLATTGFHPLDGARYLRDVKHAEPRLYGLVAHHSCARIEAEERGLADILVAEFPPEDDALSAPLIYCDMTTGPDGDRVDFDQRLAEILSRYGEADVVTRSMRRAAPTVRRAIADVEARIGQPR